MNCTSADTERCAGSHLKQSAAHSSHEKRGKLTRSFEREQRKEDQLRPGPLRLCDEIRSRHTVAHFPSRRICGERRASMARSFLTMMYHSSCASSSSSPEVCAGAGSDRQRSSTTSRWSNHSWTIASESTSAAAARSTQSDSVRRTQSSDGWQQHERPAMHMRRWWLHLMRLSYRGEIPQRSL